MYYFLIILFLVVLSATGGIRLEYPKMTSSALNESISILILQKFFSLLPYVCIS